MLPLNGYDTKNFIWNTKALNLLFYKTKLWQTHTHIHTGAHSLAEDNSIYHSPPLMSPLVLIADIDNAVINVTTEVQKIRKTPCTENKTNHVNTWVLSYNNIKYVINNSFDKNVFLLNYIVTVCLRQLLFYSHLQIKKNIYYNIITNTHNEMEHSHIPDCATTQELSLIHI